MESAGRSVQVLEGHCQEDLSMPALWREIFPKNIKVQGRLPCTWTIRIDVTQPVDYPTPGNFADTLNQARTTRWILQKASQYVLWVSCCVEVQGRYRVAHFDLVLKFLFVHVDFFHAMLRRVPSMQTGLSTLGKATAKRNCPCRLCGGRYSRKTSRYRVGTG